MAQQGSNAAARTALARHPIAVDCVRAASAITGSAAEAVVFDEGRAFVVAARDTDRVLQPRPRTSSEQSLLAGVDRVAEADGHVSVAIIDETGTPVGAISVASRDPKHRAMIAPLGRVISGVLIAETESQDLPVAAVQGLRDAVLVLGDDLAIRWANRAVGSMLGRSPAELIGRPAVDFLHPDDVERAFSAVERMSRGLEVYRLMVRLVAADGSSRPVEITGVDHSDDPGLGGMVLSIRSLASKNELSKTVERSRARTDAILQGLSDGIVATDEFGEITLVNDAARNLFGFDSDTPAASIAPADFELLDDNGRFVPVSFGPEPVDPTTPARDSGSFPSGRTYGVLSPRGELHHVTLRRESIVDVTGEGLGAVLVFHDVTAEHRAAEELQRQSLHDQLTGLANRRQLEARLTELHKLDPPATVAALFIDLDRFKLVNDSHGHRVGDEIIRIAARRLQQSMGPEDLLVRQGSDEFVVVQTGHESMDDVLEMAEMLRNKLSLPFAVEDLRFDLTASIGATLEDSEHLDAERLVQHADIAVYAAKSRGRNRVEAFDHELATAVSLEQHQRRLLRDALDDDRLVMHFQPLVDTATGITTGYEALARVRLESGELIGPASFLDAVTSSALMWELDTTAFDLSCQAAHALATIQADHPPIVACNFSAVSLTHGDLAEVVGDTLERHGVAPEQICIEITESAAFDAGPRALETLFELHRQGFRLALDDFGTGYSSLAHLRDLPIASVKVDKSFVTALADSESERAIAEAIVALADDLGLAVVAEGVETPELLEHAQRIGFGTVQGWHYSPALPLTDCIQNWLDSQSESSLSGS